MSATNYTPISLYYSATASATPTSGNLVAGELALNTNDGKLFYKDSSGVVQVLATKASASNTFSAGSTGLTPSTATTGAVTLGGTLNVANGGTGLTSLTAGYIPYGNGTSALSTNAGLTYSVGLLNVKNSTTKSTISIGDTATGTYSQLLMYGGGSNYNWSLGAQYNVANSFEITPSTAGGGNTFSTPALVITSAGNVGIGTTSPSNKLVVSGSTGTTQIQLADSTASNNLILGVNASTVDIKGVNGYPMAFYTANTEYMRLTTSGYLGIGTSSPSALLTVNGDASISGLTVGRGSGAVATNTAVGASALSSGSLSGGQNVAIGGSALLTNTTGTQNTAVGYQALTLNTTGNWNSALGIVTLAANTTGTYNVAIGYAALASNTTASYNTAIGGGALQSNTTASYNTAVGYQAGYSNTTGQVCAFGAVALSANTTGTNDAFGVNTLKSVTTGTNNAAFGTASQVNTTGSANTSVGFQSLNANTTASASTAVGYQAGYSNTTGLVTAFGYQASYAQTTGGGNSAFGNQAMRSTTTGSNNVAIGETALYSNTTASNNTAVGYQAGYTGSALNGNSVYIGYQAGYTANNGVTGAGENTFVGFRAGYGVTTGVKNTFVGIGANGTAGVGSAMTTGNNNTIIGAYTGNQGGLDIRTSSNYIVLSDGDGNPRQVIDSSGNVGIGTSSPQSYGGYTGLTIDNVTNGGFVQLNKAGTIQSLISCDTAAMSLYVPAGSGSINFSTNATERMRLDSAGNLGLGVTPSTWTAYKALQINTGGFLYGYVNEVGIGSSAYYNSGWKYTDSSYKPTWFSGANGVFYWNIASSTGTAGNAITFTQAMTLDNSGNLGIGTSSPSTKLYVSGTGSLATFGGNSSSNAVPDIQIVRSSSGTGIQTGPNITFSDSTANNTCAIQNSQGSLTFWNYGSSSWNERMRIDSSGNLLVGSTNANGKLYVENSSVTNTAKFSDTNASTTSDGVCIALAARNTTNNTFYALGYYNTGAGAYKFRVADSGNVTNTNNSYGSISDIKLKENIVDATPKLEDLCKVKVRQYNLKSDPNHKQIGVVAQELEEVFAGLVETITDKDIDGNDLGTTTKQVKYSVFVPMLIKAIQEQQDLIENLTTRLTALEAK